MRAACMKRAVGITKRILPNTVILRRTVSLDVIHVWKAERFDPDTLLKFYKDNGAKIFMALANHHDNFDLYDSKYQPWNSVAIGPKQDLIGGWAKAARKTVCASA